MNRYYYYMRMRPPMPGAMPRDGLIEARGNEIWKGGCHYWGEAVYSRKLTAEEASHYDMELHRTIIMNTEGQA